ncbi:MAG: TetR/AcrR family transcriptional regulator [Burkholderiales bacterium]
MEARKAPAREDTRTHLIHTGLRIAKRQGLRALTVRGLAQAAGVNLGTFVYHFGTRDVFVAEVIESWYAPLYDQLKVTVDASLAPIARLRALCRQLVEFLITHRRFIVHVIADAAAGEAGARTFMQTLAGRHPALLLQVIREAQAEGALGGDDPLNTMVFLLASVGGPLLGFTAIAESGLLSRAFTVALEAAAATDSAALQRLDWALRGLTASPA